MATNVSINNAEYDRQQFFTLIAELVPEQELATKNLTRPQLVVGWCTQPIRIYLREDTQRPYVASTLISSLDSTFNVSLPQVPMVPLLRHPFLFGSLLDSTINYHRTAAGALTECMFPTESLDEGEEENVVLCISISIWPSPNRLAIKRTRLGESIDYQLIRDL